jgi:insulysin
MGTEKYPDENDYNEYLNNHGGSSNAFTDMESTNYYFDVGSNHLEGALDRFAQFFIAPLFTDSATQRELQAVESEHAKNVQNDHWRQFQLYKQLAQPSHPFHKFGSGNLETLKTTPDEKGFDVRTSLLAFHAAHYSSNISKLVVLGKQSLEELQSMVEECFAPMENKNLERNVFDSQPYSSKELCQRVSVVPVSDSMRTIELAFPMREVNSLYLSKPTRYLSHLLGHEGKGSVLALLKELGWANELSAGESRGCTDWASFAVSIEVTDEGLKHANDVVEIVFAYINLIRQTGPEQWIHDETATVADCQFRFLSKRPPMDYTCSLASAMQLYLPEHVLSGPYKIHDYQPDAIVECLSYLTPSNMLLMIMDKSLEGTTKLAEKWYGTPYSLESLDEPQLDKWAKASFESELVGGADNLHLPEKNELIASDFSLREDLGAPKDEPRLYMDNKNCRLWYKPDNVFEMPKLNVIALLKSNLTEQSVKNNVLCLVWVQLLQELCTDFTYNASMASLHSSFQNSRLGVEIHVSGYNHKLNILLQRIVEEMVSLPDNVTPELFERIHDKVMKQYQQFMYSQPYQHVIYAVDLTLENAKFPIEEKMRVLEEEIALADVVDFSKALLGSHKLELLVHGNATLDEATTLANTLLDGLKPEAPSKSPERRVVKLETGREYVHRLKEFNVEDTNSSLGALYQVGVTDIETNATLSLLHHMAREPAFNELRTQEQLGYIVFSTVKTSGNNIKSLMFLIQSDSHDPIHCDGRVEAFLERFRTKLAE